MPRCIKNNNGESKFRKIFNVDLLHSTRIDLASLSDRSAAVAVTRKLHLYFMTVRINCLISGKKSASALLATVTKPNLALIRRAG